MHLGYLQMMYSTWALYSSHSITMNNDIELFQCMASMEDSQEASPLETGTTVENKTRQDVPITSRNSGDQPVSPEYEAPKPVYKTCHTGGVQFLHSGDVLYVKDIYAKREAVGRFIQMTPKTTFWGAFLLR